MAQDPTTGWCIFYLPNKKLGGVTTLFGQEMKDYTFAFMVATFTSVLFENYVC
jgi:hypothetical protein